MRPNPLSPDDLHDMALFVAVARTGSMTRASALTGIPKATLSRRIAALEARLGVALLHRRASRIALTPEGEGYRAEAEQIVQRAELLHDDLLSQRSEPAGLVRINAPPDVAVHTLAPLLGRFLLRHPQVRVMLEEHPEWVDLLERGCDVAVRVGDLRDSNLCARKLGDLPRGLLASPAYLARMGTPEVPADLVAHRCIRYTARTRGTETRWMLHRGADHHEVLLGDDLATNTAGTAHALAEAGVGIAMGIGSYCTAAVAAGRLVPVLPDWQGDPLPLFAVTLTRRLPGRVRVLVDFLAEAFGSSTAAAT